LLLSQMLCLGERFTMYLSNMADKHRERTVMIFVIVCKMIDSLLKLIRTKLNKRPIVTYLSSFSISIHIVCKLKYLIRLSKIIFRENLFIIKICKKANLILKKIFKGNIILLIYIHNFQ